ncbi:MAG TPA: alpha-amylase/4-alpha-glucanotransferase domain-containing protein, partial [Pirellulales bacterium]|nr:alpha-amylase/4-alpha-glucanotransferase domain-containing protein [Pirellulales bacterium]
TRPRGFWLAERVWEPVLAADLAAAGIEHTVLDDSRFFEAGLCEEQLTGYWLTDDNSPPIAVFAGSERLRKLIPFAPVEQVMGVLRDAARANPGAVLVYADDAEKFGAWPGMHEHCFDCGWLEQFFQALAAEDRWLRTATLRDVIDEVPPLGRVYLPDGSYREMDAWASLSTRAPHPSSIEAAEQPELPKGCWRNFRVKYPEIDNMIARMLMVSQRVSQAEQDGMRADLVAAARRELHLGQCGDAYWHGLFGGAYLPHLRQAVYRHLISAETLIDDDRRAGREVRVTIDDFNADVHREVALSNEHLSAFFTPERGGMLYELDLRRPATNLLATFAPRREPYHEPAGGDDPVASDDPAAGAHARPSGASPRHCLIDRFFAVESTLDEIASGRAIDRGQFFQRRYERRMRRHGDRARLELACAGVVDRNSVRVSKTIELSAERAELVIDYRIEGLPAGYATRFAVEFNLAGAWTSIRDLRRPTGQFAAVAAELGLDVAWQTSHEASVVMYPVQTLSRCQLGLESIVQSWAVVPTWEIVGVAGEAWSLRLSWSLGSVESAVGAVPLVSSR